MYFDDLNVDISSEDFNIDDDSDIQVRDVLVSGEVSEDEVNITSITAEAYVITRDDQDFFLGELDLMGIICDVEEYSNLKIQCENVLQDEYNNYIANDGPAIDRGEAQYDAWKEEQ